MQSITTEYKTSASGQSRVVVKSLYGTKRVLWDDALNSEDNHRAAAEKVIADINTERGTNWGIVRGAPSPCAHRGGWVYIIDRLPEHFTQQMSITVKFKPSTNTRPARMMAYSWLFPRGITVNYPTVGLSSGVADASDIGQCAAYAARAMLDKVNEKAKEHGCSYALDSYVNLYDGDRLFTLKML